MVGLVVVLDEGVYGFLVLISGPFENCVAFYYQNEVKSEVSF